MQNNFSLQIWEPYFDLLAFVISAKIAYGWGENRGEMSICIRTTHNRPSDLSVSLSLTQRIGIAAFIVTSILNAADQSEINKV